MKLNERPVYDTNSNSFTTALFVITGDLKKISNALKLVGIGGFYDGSGVGNTQGVIIYHR